jgi:hypothetical protein
MNKTSSLLSLSALLSLSLGCQLFFTSIAFADTSPESSLPQTKLTEKVITTSNTSASASALIPAFTATYTILHKSDPVGTGVRRLSYLDDGTISYSYKTDLEWFIFSDMREEVSILRLNNNIVTPIHYNYIREGTGKDKSYEWQFDAINNSGKNIKKNRTFELDFSKPLQDTLSYHLQHRITMIHNPNEKSYIYPVVKLSGTIKDYEYKYDGEEELMLPYGLVKAIRLKRESSSKKKRITYAWFAPELNYLLVKLYQTKGGTEQFEAQLNSLSFEDGHL